MNRRVVFPTFHAFFRFILTYKSPTEFFSFFLTFS
ncbi:conserved membrane protein of unknown function [Listeria monocytogenes]|nr:conserved membrane protein of unknown function [Listeria monocytogenes]GAT40626.1 conserved membrane protein of unknown function [Listeria monocytogenes]